MGCALYTSPESVELDEAHPVANYAAHEGDLGCVEVLIRRKLPCGGTDGARMLATGLEAAGGN